MYFFSLKSNFMENIYVSIILGYKYVYWVKINENLSHQSGIYYKSYASIDKILFCFLFLLYLVSFYKNVLKFVKMKHFFVVVVIKEDCCSKCNSCLIERKHYLVF